MRTFPLLAGFLCLVQLPSLQAGWVLQGKQQEGQNPPRTQTTHLDAAGIRMDSPDGLVIFQAREKKMILADAASKTYQVLDRESMKKMASGIQAAMKQMQEAMAGMTPEQKAMMEKMLGNQPMPGAAPATPAKTPVTTYKKLAGNVKVGSWTTDQYEVMQDGVKESEIWVAPPGTLAIDKDLLKLFGEMGEFFRELIAALPMAGQLGKGSLEMELTGADAPQGVPVKEVIFKEGAPASTWEITDASPADVATDKLQAPPDYVQKSILDFGN